LTGKFKGYLNRLRENLETLDEQIENARRNSKAKKKGDTQALQWAKTLRDLVELRNVTLEKIKAHLLGRDETGAVMEPRDYYDCDDNPEISFERDFDRLLSPWTRKDLKLKCKDCGVSSEQVSVRHFPGKYKDPYHIEEITPPKNIELCQKCYEKRLSQESTDQNPSQDSVKDSANPSSLDEQITSMVSMVQELPPDQRQEWIQKLKGLGVIRET